MRISQMKFLGCFYIFHTNRNIVMSRIHFLQVSIISISIRTDEISSEIDRDEVTRLTRHETWILNSRILYPRAIVSVPLRQIWAILPSIPVDSMSFGWIRVTCFAFLWKFRQRELKAKKLPCNQATAVPCIKRFVLQSKFNLLFLTTFAFHFFIFYRYIYYL